MQKEKRGIHNIDFLKMFKRSLAASLAVFIFGMQSSYAANINAGNGYNTTVTTDGSTTNITGGLLNGDTGFHHFTDFELNNGETANLYFTDGANKYVNMVDKQVSINGIFNSYKSGAIGGNVIFVSPLGMIVGSSGVINVGSLQTITPVLGTYNGLLNLGKNISWSDISSLKSDSSDSSTEINGKIFASGGIDISDGKSVKIGNNAEIVSGFNQNGFAKTTVAGFNMSDIVNSDGIVTADYMTTDTANGIKILAANITSGGSTGQALIQSSGDVNLDVSSTGGITLGAQVSSGKDINIGKNSSNSIRTIVLNKNINATGDVNLTSNLSITQNKNSNINSNKFNATSSIMTVNGNVTAKNGININEGNPGTNFTQAYTSEIVNTTSGDINVRSLSATTNKITNQAANGNINLYGDLTLKNTIKTQDGSISVTGIGLNPMTQTSNDVLAFDSAKHLDITAYSDVGTSTQAINVAVKGDVKAVGNTENALYLSSKGTDLNVSSITDTNKISLTSDKAINLKQNVEANDSITLNAQTGVTQATESSLYSGGSGGINITNQTSGNVTLTQVTSSGGQINVTNNSDSGSVVLISNINSDKTVSIASKNGITQQATSNIVVDGTASDSINLTNTGSGDIKLNNISNTNGNIVVNNSQGTAPVPGNVIASGTLSTTNGYVDISSGGAYTQTGSVTAGGSNASGNSVTVAAQNDATIAQITATNGIKLTADNVILNNLVKSNTGAINIDTTKSITQTSDTKSLDAAGLITLNAGTDIGSKDKNIIFSSPTGILATAGGGVNITGIDSNIELNNITAGTDYNITTTGTGDIVVNKDLSNVQGDFSLTTDKDLTINDNIGALGDITLTTNNGDIILNAVVTSVNEGISLTAQGGIYQKDTFNNTSLIANKDIHLIAQTKDVGAVTKSILMESAGQVYVDGGNVFIESPKTLNIAAVNSEKTNPTGVVSIKTNNSTDGNINLNGLVKGSQITLDASQGITQTTATKTHDNTGALNLKTANGDIGTTEKAIVFSADTVSADSSKSVILKGIDSDIKTAAITANENIDLATEITSPSVEKGKIIIH